MKLSKIFSIIVIAIMLVAAISNVVFASSISLNPGDISITQNENNKEIQTLGGRIVGVIQTVGSVVALIVLVILGVKYMMGSAEEKAEYKKTMIPYFIGAILIFAASAISSVIYNAATGLNS